MVHTCQFLLSLKKHHNCRWLAQHPVSFDEGGPIIGVINAFLYLRKGGMR